MPPRQCPPLHAMPASSHKRQSRLETAQPSSRARPLTTFTGRVPVQRAGDAAFFYAPRRPRGLEKISDIARPVPRDAGPKGRPMPKRTDIATIMIIGAGPIVIGQACEFDYSGTQACKALRDEGYRIVLVNSNPATIMTDPDMADRTYVEPITPEIVAKIIEKERYAVPGGFALLPTMGGQTALNCALRLEKMGVLEEIRRRDDRRHRGGDRQGRGPRAVPRGDDPDRPRHAALASRQDAGRGAGRAGRHRPARDHPPLLHAGRHRRRHRLQQGRVHRHRRSAASTPRRPTRC